jgi:hypothetical protein
MTALCGWLLLGWPLAADVPPEAEVDLTWRAGPSTATWKGPPDGAWQDAKNWSWDNARLNGHYPGDTAGRFDNMKFDAIRLENGKFAKTNRANCVLAANLKEKLNSLALIAGYNGNVILKADVVVGGAGTFSQWGGTVSITRGKTLVLAATTGGSHVWAGGTIAHAGTLKVYDSVLVVRGSAGSLGTNLVIGGTTGKGGKVVLGDAGTPMHTNFSLSGDGNTINVQASGTLSLNQDLTAREPFQKGGITGGWSSPITVSSGGRMTRGSPAKTIGGSVLVDVPVKLDGGTFQIYEATPEKAKDAIWFRGKFDRRDPHAGSGVVLTGDPSKFIQGVHTDVTVRHGVRISSRGATYQASVNPKVGAAGQSLIGNLTFVDGGCLTLFDEAPGTTGAFGITGDLTLADNTEVRLNWTALTADFINVTGVAKLAGTLSMSGPGPMNQGFGRKILSASKAANSFSSSRWTGANATISGARKNKNTEFAVQWD